MKKIGGNIEAVFQIKFSGGKNPIGENIEDWMDALKVTGFLDYSSGQNSVGQYNAKVQDSTHFFFCDFNAFEYVTDDFLWDPFDFDNGIVYSDNTTNQKFHFPLTSENCRMVIGGKIYHVILVDDPMGMHQHFEIYLKYIGGGLGV